MYEIFAKVALQTMCLHLRRRHATNQMKLPTTEQASVSNESWPFIRYFIYLFFPGNIFPWKVARPPKKAQNVSEISSKKAPLIQNSKKFVKTPKNSRKNQVTFSIPLSSYFLEFSGSFKFISIYTKSHWRKTQTAFVDLEKSSKSVILVIQESS